MPPLFLPSIGGPTTGKGGFWNNGTRTHRFFLHIEYILIRILRQIYGYRALDLEDMMRDGGHGNEMFPAQSLAAIMFNAAADEDEDDMDVDGTAAAARDDDNNNNNNN